MHSRTVTTYSSVHLTFAFFDFCPSWVSGWQKAIIGMLIFAVVFAFIGGTLAVVGVFVKYIPQKLYYFHSAGETFLVTGRLTSDSTCERCLNSGGRLQQVLFHRYVCYGSTGYLPLHDRQDTKIVQLSAWLRVRADLAGHRTSLRVCVHYDDGRN